MDGSAKSSSTVHTFGDTKFLSKLFGFGGELNLAQAGNIQHSIFF